MKNTKQHKAKKKKPKGFFVIFVELRVFVVAFKTGAQ